MSPSRFFAQSYAEARGKFIAACEAAGLDLHSHPHPLLGRDGEALAMDVARLGPADAPALLMVTSACHGVEGFCGSGVQGALLADAAFLAEAKARGVAVLFVHALNPWGFSWWRRTTHENVDLNRNWHDFHAPLPANPGYDELAHFVVPAAWPPTAENEAHIEAFRQQRGDRALQTALSGGQYDHPEGIFYGGRSATWSQQTFRHVLQEHATRCRRIGWIDLHTGLGPAGHGERIFACRDDAAALARARAWWGPNVTSIYDGSSTSALLQGLMFHGLYEECPQAEYTGIALEYGTVPLWDVMHAMRADQWLENHPEMHDAVARPIKQRLRDVFYTDTDAWKAQIAAQGAEVAFQGLRGIVS